MNKILAAAALCLFTGGCNGIDNQTQSKDPMDQYPPTYIDRPPSVYIDPETSCQYFVSSTPWGRGAGKMVMSMMSPRMYMDTSGTIRQKGCKAK